MERRVALGVQSMESRELHGFLKDRSGGTAAAIIRKNRSRVGLESWRLLCKQFNPQTLQATLQAHQLETHPKPASRMSDLPQCILEWEKSLLRCAQEGRDPPSDGTKHLALLRMIPSKQRQQIWQTANKLYHPPTITLNSEIPSIAAVGKKFFVPT